MSECYAPMYCLLIKSPTLLPHGRILYETLSTYEIES